MATTTNPENEDGLAWLQVLVDGRVRFFCPRMEMGQGAPIGLSQIVAEELNLDQAQIECVTPATNQSPPFKMTVGSESIAVFSEPVSLAAATLREYLRERAAATSGLPVGQLKDAPGGFEAAGRHFFGYGDLISEEAIVLHADDYSSVEQYFNAGKNPYNAVGKRWPSPDIENIVTGKVVYSRDVSLPGMLFGDVVRPPRFGATLIDAKVKAETALSNGQVLVIDVVNNLVGVVSDNPFMLADALEKIEPVWALPKDAPGLDKLDIARYRGNGDFEHTLIDNGNEALVGDAGVQSITANYTTSYMAHAAMEPGAAVASVRKSGVEIWCGCQDPYFIRGRVAALLQRDEGDVIIHPLRMGGGFGGRVLSQPAEEAALLSAHVGRPVRVQWNREAEFQHNYFQPKFSHAIDSGLDETGKIAYWHHDFVSSPIIFGLVPKGLASILDTFVADKGTARGAKPPYAIEHQRLRYSDIRTDTPTGAWRGLGAAPNTFAIESIMDELAFAAGKDPLAFRLAHLVGDGQHIAQLSGVLRQVGDLSGWGRSVAKDRGLGIACATYKDQTHVAVVADVAIDHSERQVNVVKLWCAQNSGLVINPDQVENQVLGNLVWGCGMALKEKLTVSDGIVNERNFDTYEILRHEEAPEVDIKLVDTMQAKPLAVGEAAFAPTVAAIANAAFAASGKRPRSLPFNYDSLYT
ncbi:MAG: xanthine dehydrogenase family protein molybdopterin-binding subunit [Rhodospirillaceae bacterium]|nr:xanthine dehydrogenase family protein molybdopterin-binding subunit [Rhodospirillaceae bacterium]